MICLFDRYDQASFDLLRSLKATGLDCPVVVVQDDGYLSPDVESPYSYFTGDLDTPEGRPIYFNLVPKPHLWEIRSSNVNGEILDMGKKRANIFYRQPTHERRVRAV
ncbi:accessory Sec system glycosylation chaperone GtfB, partial [Listeria monocytogenes]